MSSEDNQVPETYFKLAKFRNVPKLTSILEFTDYCSDVQTAVSKLFHNAIERKWLLETEMEYWLKVVMENTKREYWTMQFVLQVVTRFIDLVLKLRLLNEMSLSTSNPPSRVNFLAVIPAIEQKLRGLTNEARAVKRNSTNSAVVKRVRFAPIAGKKKTPLPVPVFPEKAPVPTTETVRPLTEPTVPPAEPIVPSAEPIVTPAKPIVSPAEPIVPVSEPTLLQFEPTGPFSDPALPPLEPIVFPTQSAVPSPVSGMRGLRPSTPQVKQMIGLAPTVPKNKENERTFKLKEVKKKKKKFTKFLSLARIDEDPIVVTGRTVSGEKRTSDDPDDINFCGDIPVIEETLPELMNEESESLVDSIVFAMQNSNEFVELKLKKSPRKVVDESNFFNFLPVPETFKNLIDIDTTPTKSKINNNFGEDASDESASNTPRLIDNICGTPPGTAVPAHNPMFSWDFVPNEVDSNDKCNGKQEINQEFVPLKPSTSEPVKFSLPKIHSTPLKAPNANSSKHSRSVGRSLFRAMTTSPNSELIMERSPEAHMKNTSQERKSPVRISPFKTEFGFSNMVVTPTRDDDRLLEVPTDHTVPQQNVCNNDLVSTTTPNTPVNSTFSAGIDSTYLIPISSSTVNAGNPSSLVSAPTKVDGKVDQLPVCASVLDDLISQLKNLQDLDLVSTTTPNTSVNSTSSAEIDSTYLIPVSSSSVNAGNPSSLVSAPTKVDGEVDQLPVCASVLDDLISQLKNLHSLDLVSTTTPNTPVNSTSSAEIDSTYSIPISSSSVNAGNPSFLVSVSTEPDGEVDQLPICSSILNDLVTQLEDSQDLDGCDAASPSVEVVALIEANSLQLANFSELVSETALIENFVHFPFEIAFDDDTFDDLFSVTAKLTSSERLARLKKEYYEWLYDQERKSDPSVSYCWKKMDYGEGRLMPWWCRTNLHPTMTQAVDHKEAAASPSVEVVALIEANSLQSDNFSELVPETARIENIVHFPFEFDDDILSVTAKLTSSERLARLKKEYYEWLYDKDTQKQKSGPSVSYCWKKMDYGEGRLMPWWCRTNLHPTMTQAVDHKEAAASPSVEVVALIEANSLQSDNFSELVPETARIENIVHFPFEFDDDILSVTAKLTSSERLARLKKEYYEWLYDKDTQKQKSGPSVSYCWKKMDYGEGRLMPWWCRTNLHPTMTQAVDHKEAAASPSVEVVALIEANSLQLDNFPELVSETARIENIVHFPFEIAFDDDAFDDLFSVTAKLTSSERLARHKNKYYEWLYDQERKSDPSVSYLWEKMDYGEERFMPWWYRTILHPEMTAFVDYEKVKTNGLKDDSLDEYEDALDDHSMIDLVTASTELDSEVDQLPICTSVSNDLVTPLEHDLDGCDAASPSVEVVALIEANSLQLANFSELVSETASIENFVHFPFEIAFDDDAFDDLFSVTAKLTSSERLARLKKEYYEWLYDKDTQKQKSGPSVSYCWKKMDYGEERFMPWWCRTNLHPTMTQAVDHKEAAAPPSVEVVALIEANSLQLANFSELVSETARIENFVHFPFEIAFDDDAFDDLFSVTAKLTSSERLARLKKEYYEWLYDKDTQKQKSGPSVSYCWKKMDYGEGRLMPWWCRTNLHPTMTQVVDHKEAAVFSSVEVVAPIDDTSLQSETARIENIVHFPFEIAFDDDLLSVTAKVTSSERLAPHRNKYYEWLYDQERKSDPSVSYLWEKMDYGEERFMPWWYRTLLHPEMTAFVDYKKVKTNGLKDDSLDEYEDALDDHSMIDLVTVSTELDSEVDQLPICTSVSNDLVTPLEHDLGSIPLSEKRTCTLRRCPADHYHTRTLGPSFKKRLAPWQ